MSVNSDLSTLSAVNGESVVQACGFHPMVAVLTSNGADTICKKNNLSSFADLLAPFSNVTIVIKDPIGAQASTRIKVDFRDIAKSGCLLSLTVLPSVLDQIVSYISSANLTDDVWSAGFRDAFCYWFEPSENDFFKSYLCCIFVVSAEEEDPLGELARLIQKQNTQQHGGAESTTVLGPPHCSSPKWFLPNILKSYVLLHDVTVGNEEKANDTFGKMSAIYGSDCCFFLKVNSEQEALDLPDPWQQILDQRYCGLESGLELARRRLMEINNTTNNSSVISPNVSSSSLPIAATFSSSLSTPMFSTVSSSNVVVPSSSTNDFSVSSSRASTNGFRPCGQCLSTSDREGIRELVEGFVKRLLVPFVEKQIMAQNDVLQNRRGIGKSFTSMRKWLSAASTPTAPVSYGSESTEIQTRRLADLAFLFGLNAFAHSLYQTVKKDFANDNAKVYHAGALEMATLTFYLSSTPVVPKQIPVRYLDAAMDIYMTECNPLLALRCCMISVEILSRVSMFAEAANQLIRLTSNRPNQPGSEMLSDFYSGVLLEKAAYLLFQAKMYRRRAFNFILAGHRFNQAAQKALSLKCYNNAAEEYLDKKWQFAENHIIFTLTQGSIDPRFQMDCVTKLVNPTDSRLVDQPTQMAFVEYFIRTLAANGAQNVEFVLPLLDPGSITVIYGEKPDVLEPEVHQWQVQDEKDAVHWEDLERACFHATAGNQKPFLRECPLFSDATTKNQHRKETSPFERFRVQFKLVNPLLVPLTLKNLKLGVEEVVMKSGHSENEAFIDFGTIPELVLPATEPAVYNSISNENTATTVSETLVELYVIPTDKLLTFSVNTLHFDLVATDGTCVSGKKQIILKKKRLFKTKEQRMKKLYAADQRLSATVSTHQWPLLNVEFSGQAARSKEIHAYCSQIFQVMVTFENVGVIPIHGISIGTDQPENVSISESGIDNQQWVLCPARLGNNLLCHTVSPNHARLSPQSKLTTRMAIKAPDEVVENQTYRILFFYLGENGYYREHRYLVKMSTKPLLRCIPKVLNEQHQLCAIEMKNLIPARDTVLAKVEFLRLTCIFTADDDDSAPDINLELVIKRQVIIEGEQSDIIPFYIKTDSQNQPVIWLSDAICDIPAFNNIIKHQFKRAIELAQQQGNPPSRNSITPDLPRAHLRFALLWKAHVAGITGNVATLFGETWIPNPFSLESLNRFSAEPIEEERKFFNTGIPTLNGKFAMVLTEQDRLSFLATKTPTYNQMTLTKKEIIWRLPTMNLITEMDGNLFKTIVCKISTPSTTIIHDFKTKKECRFEISLAIFNSDPLRRTVNVIVFTGSDILQMQSLPIYSKENDKDPMNIKANVLQPKLSVDKVRVSAKIGYGETANFQLNFKAFQACAYNLTEVIGVEACIQDENVEIPSYHRLVVPQTYMLIKPPKQFSRESTRSPLSMFPADNNSYKARV